jgi:NAD(P)-dependent dehydrogenase (short-subunit alcohol dehydrogenase family)
MITVVVGVGPGMGLALARRFGREGGTVAMLARRPEALQSYVEELAAEGVLARGFAADVADETSLRAAFAAVRTELGDPDVLLYNASALHMGAPGDALVADVEHSFRVGALGALVAAQEVLPAMRARGAGTILVTGGGAALRPWAAAVGLGMSKAAVRNLALALHADLRDTGVRAGTVTITGTVGSPGYDPTDIADRFWAWHTAEQPEAEVEVTA